MLGSMPLAFGTTLDAVPAEPAYLSAEPDRAAQWAERIGPKGFRVGIVWQGANMPNSDKRRAMPLAHFSGLAKLPNVRLISLQKGLGSDQLEDPLFGLEMETLGPNFDSGPDAFIDSAAVMQSLDLVICCDTAIAHVAGALGKPVWVALRTAPDWRWLLERSDTPWYPSMRLFRQSRRGDWTDVFQHIEEALRRTLDKTVTGRRDG
jgi:ADP-heptose:LPS heptosyltransferase